ncbi:MAG: 16S rRNA (guanine(966)-N(2))-methyltransferase RsmD [Alphaproteobacteria bacterium]
MRIIGGLKKGLKLSPLNAKNTRPTMDRTREDIMNIIMHSGFKDYLIGKNVADVFAGTGAVGLEMISRGASSCTFFENNKDALTTLKQNIQKTGFTDTNIQMDATKIKTNTSFDLIFMDAPYELGLTEKAIASLLNNNCITNNTLLIIQVGKEEDFPSVDNFEIIKEKTAGGGKVAFLTHKP